eukprot:TRINITY_DN61117_c0_g1_i1.p1 TRINITY_DN61117_c0_g1~~TRINITY_DN61117_c0_g1_i1.p1  ORF type:complete len:310 (-),score=47.03 TRINITY_DN61117_c0_g1_i1:28-957(-)
MLQAPFARSMPAVDERQRQEHSFRLMALELQHLRDRVHALTTEVAEGKQRLLEVNSHWEVRLKRERETHLLEFQTFQNEKAALARALEAERAQRTHDYNLAQGMASQFDAKQQQSLLRRNESEVLARRADEARCSAELALRQAEEKMHRTIEVMQRERDTEVAELKQQLFFERRQRLAAQQALSGDAVSVVEANRALDLIATLWHAAGWKQPARISSISHRGHEDEDVLFAWRSYYNRGADTEPAFLCPTNDIVYGPFQAVVGNASAEHAISQIPPWAFSSPTETLPVSAVPLPYSLVSCLNASHPAPL